MDAKQKWLTGLVAILVILNIGLIAFTWLNHERGEAGKGPGDARDFLVKDLRLNKQQEKAFDSLRSAHFTRMKAYHDEMRQLKDQLFSGLSSPAPAGQETVATKIGEVQKKIDLETFYHFYGLRKILTEEQQRKFDVIIRDVLRNLGPRRGPGPGEKPQGWWGTSPFANPDGPPPPGGPPPQ
jgi:hypothetical protein